MEPKDIAIIGLAVIVILLIGFLLGQRKTSANTLNFRLPSPQNTAESSYPTALAPANTHVTPPARPLRNYSKQISGAQIYHQRVAVVHSVMAENRVYGPFNDKFGLINDAYERFDTDKQEHTREELLTIFSSLLEISKFDRVQKELTDAAEVIAQGIIAYYDDQVSIIFSGQPFETLSTKYALNADLRASQLAKISAIVTNHFSSVITGLKDIELHRNWLQSNFQIYVEGTNDEFDWGNSARNFGAGALAVAHPIVGIPALIANFKLQSNRDKANSAQINHYFERFGEFEDKILSVRQQITRSAEQTKCYVDTKFTEICQTGVAAILTEISADGYKLDHYFKSLDLKKLERSERELHAEGA